MGAKGNGWAHVALRVLGRGGLFSMGPSITPFQQEYPGLKPRRSATPSSGDILQA